MKKSILLFITLLSLSVFAQESKKSSLPDPELTEVWSPEPPGVVTRPGAAPSDAIILFDGSNTDAWQHSDGSEVKWTKEGEALVVQKGTGAIKTKDSFGSIQLHIEWRCPAEIEGEGQGRGNSGIFLQSRYELQVLDSYDNRTYSNGQAGSIYKQSMPLVNASREPGNWQTYDIIYHAPTFENGLEYNQHPRITVLHNGVLIQDHTKILGSTEYRGAPKVRMHGDAPITLQDHGNPVAYRNIWVRKI